MARVAIRHRQAICALALLMPVLMTACDSSNPDPSEPGAAVGALAILSSSDEEIVARLRDGINYAEYDSPRDLAFARSAIFVGSVSDVVEGRSLLAESEGLRTRDSTVVLKVKVEEVIKDTGDVSDEGYIYVSMPRGVNGLTDSGEIVPEDPNPQVNEVREALVGVRVAVISEPDDLNEVLEHPAVTLESDPNPVPDRANLLAGVHPQTVVFDQGEEFLTDWPEFKFKDLVDALEASR